MYTICGMIFMEVELGWVLNLVRILTSECIQSRFMNSCSYLNVFKLLHIRIKVVFDACCSPWESCSSDQKNQHE